MSCQCQLAGDLLLIDALEPGARGSRVLNSQHNTNRSGKWERHAERIDKIVPVSQVPGEAREPSILAQYPNSASHYLQLHGRRKITGRRCNHVPVPKLILLVHDTVLWLW